MDLYLIHDHLAIMMELGKKRRGELQHFNRKPRSKRRSVILEFRTKQYTYIY